MIELFCVVAPVPFLKGVIRDIRPTWVLEETKLPYEIKWIENSKIKSPEYLKIHPFGHVPAMRDGDFVLFESGAICEYLAEKAHQLIPAADTRERHLHHQWMLLSLTNFDAFSAQFFAAEMFPQGNGESEKKEKQDILDFMQHYLEGLNEALTHRSYLMNEFTVADIMLSCTLRFLWQKNYLNEHPALCRYLERNWNRPAARKAYELNGKI